MAQTVITLEDLLAFETRVKAFINVKIHELQESPKPLFYTVSEVARMLRLSTYSVRRKLVNPDEPFLRGVQASGVKGQWLVSQESVNALLKSLETNR